MPHTATPHVLPAEVRVGDILPSGVPVTERPSLVSKGPRKGQVRVETENGTLVLAPEGGFHVQREVPTEEERTTYIAAYTRFTALVETVQARTALDRAVAELERAIASLKRDALGSGGRSALRGEPGEVEFATGAYRAVWKQHGEVLFEDGFTPEVVAELAVHGRMSTGLFQHAPKHMPNDDCHFDGTPAARNGFERVAPAYARQEG